MPKTLILFIILIVIVIIGYFIFQKQEDITSFEQCIKHYPVMETYPRQCRANDEIFVEYIGNELEKLDLIRIDNPRPNQAVTSPLLIQGEARGYWFFEGDFPVKLIIGDKVITGIATAKGEWMTEDFVAFESSIEFETQASSGELILIKDNASGLPEHDDQLIIPVKF